MQDLWRVIVRLLLLEMLYLAEGRKDIKRNEDVLVVLEENNKREKIELKYCPDCIQMTNYKDDMCLKCMAKLKAKLSRFKHYTHKELSELERQGIGGDVCRCQAVIENTMTVECVMCGKILPRFARNYLKRN